MRYLRFAGSGHRKRRCVHAKAPLRIVERADPKPCPGTCRGGLMNPSSPRTQPAASRATRCCTLKWGTAPFSPYAPVKLKTGGCPYL